MKIDRRRMLFGMATAGLVVLARPGIVWADDDDDGDEDENRPNNRVDQPGMSESEREADHNGYPESDSESASTADQEFLMMAVSGNATEVEAGQIAQERGSSSEVKQFGQRMVRDHGQALEESAQLALAFGVEPPKSPVTDQQKMLIQNLMDLSGQEFDRFYMRAMVMDHRTDVAVYEDAVVERSEEIAEYASKWLPTLREHLMMAEDGAQRVGADLGEM